MTEQTKFKISIKLRGRKKSAITKKKISNALKGVKKSKEHKQSIADAMTYFWENLKKQG